MYDMLIIGGGPAALSAASYAMGKQLNAMMVYHELGGKIGWLDSLGGSVAQPRLPGNDLAQVLTRRLLRQADRTLNDRVCRVDLHGAAFNVVTEAHGTLRSRTVLVATGARPLPLDVPGAGRLVDHGLGYSATTHAHLVRGQRAVVIGGGTRALSGAAELAAIAREVVVIAPDAVPATVPLARALRNAARVEILEHSEVLEVVGDTRVEAVLVRHEGQQTRIAADHVFVALGVVPNSELVHQLVRTSSHGHIMVTAYHESTLPGLFAAGDVSSIFSEQVVIAIGDGARAARTAYDYLLAQKLVPVPV